ncbi:MAG: hypothetical protein H7840_00220 [Alphaproteobacteria bacterium]
MRGTNRNAKAPGAAAGLILALGVAVAGPAAASDDVLAAFASLSTTELGGLSGGAETVDLRTIVQGNSSDSRAANTASGISNEGAGASMANGAIAPALLSGNHGVASVIQNTGNLVNMNYTMSVNIYLQ